MKIEVTAEDIELGERHCGDSCPIARAFTRNLKGLKLNKVGIRTVGFWETDADGRMTCWNSVSLPLAATKFIKAFDAWEPVEPFSFELDLPV